MSPLPLCRSGGHSDVKAKTDSQRFGATTGLDFVLAHANHRLFDHIGRFDDFCFGAAHNPELSAYLYLSP